MSATYQNSTSTNPVEIPTIINIVNYLHMDIFVHSPGMYEGLDPTVIMALGMVAAGAAFLAMLVRREKIRRFRRNEW